MPRLPELPDEAYVMEDSGSVLVCPWDLRQQVADAALSARQGVPSGLADAFVPPSLVTVAQQVSAQWQDGSRALEDGTAKLHEQSSCWTIPLRWFVYVDLDEKELSLGAERRLRYRTSMARARRRAHRGLSVLRRSVVELDYGGLTALLSDDQLSEDDSPGLAAEGLAALAREDPEAASGAYEGLVDRWRSIQLLERCN